MKRPSNTLIVLTTLITTLGRIGPALLASLPPYGLESYTTLIIQALDLGLIMPTAFLSGILFWKQRPWGYLLASIVLVKGFTMLLAISAMVVNMILAGVQVSIGMTVTLLRNVSEPVCPSA